MSVKYERYANARSESGALDPETRCSWQNKEQALANRHHIFPNTYKITVEEIEEEPQWWWWYCCDRKWGSIPNHRDKVGVQVADNLSGISLSVYGTTADRDAKRDALLAAAKAAGKGGEG